VSCRVDQGRRCTPEFGDKVLVVNGVPVKEPDQFILAVIAADADARLENPSSLSLSELQPEANSMTTHKFDNHVALDAVSIVVRAGSNSPNGGEYRLFVQKLRGTTRTDSGP